MIYVLLPAYNEEHALLPLCEKISAVMAESKTKYQIVVVNDGSKDATATILKDLSSHYPLVAITHKYNRGLGETARDGFEYIAENAGPEDIAIRMDCDDTHDPKYIPAMIARIQEGYEVVTTSRYFPGGGQIGVNLYRRTISRIANLLLKMIFPIPGLKEYTCGFRAYRAAALQDAIEIFGNQFIDLKGMGFTGTVEKLIKFKLIGARVGEIPFVLRYDQKQSVSKVVTSLTTLGYFTLIAKYGIFWNRTPQEWKRKIAERKKRVYDECGRVLEPARRGV